MLRALEPVIEFHEETAEDTLVILRFMFLEDHGTESRRQRQGDESRQGHGNRNSQGELLIQNTRHAAEERNRYEHGCQNKGNSHNRALYLVHGPLRRIDWLEAFLHVLLDILDDDDGIIDDQADGQHHCKECQRIDGEVQHNERSQCTDQGYWHSQQRNDCSPPVLQEQEDNQHNQCQCFEERLHNFLDGSIDIVRTIEDLRHLQVWWQIWFCLLQDLLDALNRLHGICIIGQVDTKTNGRIAIKLRDNRVRFLPGLDTGHVLQTNELAIRGFQDDIAELLRCHQTTGYLARVLSFLTICHWHSTNGTCRCLDILLFERARDIRHGELELSELIRVQPDTHRIIRAEDLNITDTSNTLDLIQDVDIGIVLHERTVIRAIR